MDNALLLLSVLLSAALSSADAARSLAQLASQFESPSSPTPAAIETSTITSPAPSGSVLNQHGYTRVSERLQELGCASANGRRLKQFPGASSPLGQNFLRNLPAGSSSQIPRQVNNIATAFRDNQVQISPDVASAVSSNLLARQVLLSRPELASQIGTIPDPPPQAQGLVTVLANMAGLAQNLDNSNVNANNFLTQSAATNPQLGSLLSSVSGRRLLQDVGRQLQATTDIFTVLDHATQAPSDEFVATPAISDVSSVAPEADSYLPDSAISDVSAAGPEGSYLEDPAAGDLPGRNTVLVASPAGSSGGLVDTYAAPPADEPIRTASPSPSPSPPPSPSPNSLIGLSPITLLPGSAPVTIPTINANSTALQSLNDSSGGLFPGDSDSFVAQSGSSQQPAVTRKAALVLCLS
ncbi:hypothetical protein WJX73_002671 [Symbiochloris irregularis]|uniref:Uncharacterized protein n=1 Tax=Symbiochloris irregularis TaxID=706552 RepID=A0AAW1NRA7_9CHLO